MPNHFTLTFFLAAKGARYHVAIATVIISHVKISCFRAKAHLVFHWYLYNKMYYAQCFIHRGHEYGYSWLLHTENAGE